MHNLINYVIRSDEMHCQAKKQTGTCVARKQGTMHGAERRLSWEGRTMRYGLNVIQ